MNNLLFGASDFEIVVFVSLIQVNNLLFGASDFGDRCLRELDSGERCP